MDEFKPKYLTPDEIRAGFAATLKQIEAQHLQARLNFIVSLAQIAAVEAELKRMEPTA